MARSVIWPRRSKGDSWFCAELVAAVLQAGNVIEAAYNPGEATPESLYRRFHGKFATAANPYVLNQISRSRVNGGAASACGTHVKLSNVPNKGQRAVIAPSGWMQPVERPGAVYALSPWKLSTDSRGATPEELEPLVHRYFGGNVSVPPSGTVTPCGPVSIDTAAAIRDAVARAGVLQIAQERTLGGMYDRV